MLIQYEISMKLLCPNILDQQSVFDQWSASKACSVENQSLISADQVQNHYEVRM